MTLVNEDAISKVESSFCCWCWKIFREKLQKQLSDSSQRGNDLALGDTWVFFCDGYFVEFKFVNQ